MSYDIYFVKGDKLSSEDLDELLESDASEGDDHFISKALMNEVKDALADSGLSFETFEGKEDDYLELNFESYQISMTNSEIAALLPYWDVNASDKIGDEVEVIAKVLMQRGFTGYDPQTGKLFNESSAFSTDFGRVNERVNDDFSQEARNKKPSEFWRLIKVGVIFVVVFLAVKLLASLISKLLN